MKVFVQTLSEDLHPSLWAQDLVFLCEERRWRIRGPRDGGGEMMIKSIDVNADLAETWGVYPTPQHVWRVAWDRGEGTMIPVSPIAGSDLETILSIISS